MELSSAEERMQSARNNADSYERQIRSLAPQIQAIRNAVIPKEMTDPDYLAAIVRDISNLPQVDTLLGGNDDTHLIVRTKLINMTVTMHDGCEYTTEAGIFTLQLNFTTPSVRVLNTSEYSIGSYQHPHISNNDFCLGGARELVYSLMRDLQFATAVEVLIDQLSLVNPDDCYTSDWYDFFGDQLHDYMNDDDNDDID